MNENAVNKVEKELTIINNLGLHARASAKLVKAASGFGCDIKLIQDTKEVDAKSIMGVMMLAAKKGTKLTVRTEGEDAEKAHKAIEDLINDYFGEGQ